MFRLPGDISQYRRSFSAHLNLSKKTQSSERHPNLSKSISNQKQLKKCKNKQSIKSLYIKRLMKIKKAQQEQIKRIVATPSAYALIQKKLIPPCSTNYQYCISENDLSGFVQKPQLLEPGKYLSNSLKSRPYTPTNSQNQTKTFTRYSKTAKQTYRKNSARKKNMNKSINQVKRNDLLIQPWEIGEEFVEYIYSKK